MFTRNKNARLERPRLAAGLVSALVAVLVIARIVRNGQVEWRQWLPRAW